MTRVIFASAFILGALLAACSGSESIEIDGATVKVSNKSIIISSSDLGYEAQSFSSINIFGIDGRPLNIPENISNVEATDDANSSSTLDKAEAPIDCEYCRCESSSGACDCFNCTI